MTRAKTSTVAIAILRFLLGLERGGGGFRRRGVSGWATGAEIHAGTGSSYLSEDLRSLHAAGRVIRDDARIPGTRAPAWAYRITDAGARHLAGELQTVHVPVRDPAAAGDEGVYVRPGIAAALRALRHASEKALRKPLVPAEPEWRTSRQLSAWLDEARTGREPRFFSDELAWMVRAGLAERRDEPATLYRIAPAGLAVKPMVWREPAEITPAATG